ncbi:MAG: hypothetical protein AAF367_17835 [Pseudomonadota bacterium]
MKPSIIVHFVCDVGDRRSASPTVKAAEDWTALRTGEQLSLFGFV